MDAVLNDTSRLQNPTYSYSQTGTYNATLIVSTSKGCIDTIQREVTIVDKPEFRVTNDTLICSVDTLRLQAISPYARGGYLDPNTRINNVNSFSPLVWPNVTTRYIARFVDHAGCTALDTVLVNVVDSVTLSINPDTTICRTDPVVLKPRTDALAFSWTPTATLDNPAIKTQRLRLPRLQQRITSRPGSVNACDRDSIKVKTVPYPIARSIKDTSICFGQSVPLTASGGSNYVWTPSLYLPIPLYRTRFPFNRRRHHLFTVGQGYIGLPQTGKRYRYHYRHQGCGRCRPQGYVHCSRSALFLQATGGSIYNWTPVTQWLSATNVSNPTANPQNDIEYVVQVSNAIGCFDDDSISVKVYKVAPDMYVPTGFSPNGDGLNEILRPLALGMRSVDIFMVYNRWGQLMFHTTNIGEGWDGRYGGKEQAPGSYVWYAEGTDYLNRKISRKGSVVLIR